MPINLTTLNIILKELFYLLDEQDDDVPNGKIHARSLGVELAAGGVSHEHTEYVSTD